MCQLLISFPGASVVKNPPAQQEMWVLSLGQEDALKEEVATHPSLLVWDIPRTEEPGGLQSVGPQRVNTTQRLNHCQQLLNVVTSFIAENGV